MAVTALLSLKGGTGKTTTVLNLGASLARRGARVLLIDLDPQASLTYALQTERQEDGPTIRDVLLGKEAIHDVLAQAKQENLFLCASDMRLLELPWDAHEWKKAGRRLAESLRTARRKNSHVLIDCPPGLTPLSVLSLQASDCYLVPTTATPVSMEALRRFLEHLQETGKEMGAEARFVGIVATMVNPYLRLTVDVLREMRATFKKDVFSTVIRQSVRLAESPGKGQSIFDYAPESIGAENYNRLRKEFLHRLQS